MKKCFWLEIVFFLVIAAVFDAQVVLAGVDPLASPTPQPTERIAAPVIIGINPVVRLSEGNQGDTHPSDNLLPAFRPGNDGIDLPNFVDLEADPLPGSRGDGYFLDVPLRSQGEGTVNCGPASLGMALDYLERDQSTQLPTTPELSAYLSSQGLMYDWGTGVEELAYAARNFGYLGSYAFHNWNLEQLEGELKLGNPPILALGSAGQQGPGHFVTLTGISLAENRVRVNDPIQGELTYTIEEFQKLWDLQGNSGTLPVKKLPPPEKDSFLPWMGLFSLVSLFGYSFSQLADTRQRRWIEKMRNSLANPLRQGVGGGLTTAQGAQDKIKTPLVKEEIKYRGLRTIEHEVPIYETRRIQVGLRGVKKKVPQYEQKQIQVGTKTVSTRVPVYRTERVQTGSKLVPKRITVTKYKTTQVLEWKKTTRKVPVYRKVGSRRILIDVKTDIRWKKLPVTKRVPYQETKTIYQQIPVYGEKKVLTGCRNESKQVPQYETRNLLVGYKTITESEPVYEMRQIQVGTKTVTRQVPDYEIVKIPLHESHTEDEGDLGDLIGQPLMFPGNSQQDPSGLDGDIPTNSCPVNVSSDSEIQDKLWVKMLVAFKRNIFDPYIQLKEHPDEVLKGITPEKLPKFLSVSAHANWDINIFKQEGAVLSTYTPPGFLEYFYMQQKLDVAPKSVVTVNPGAAANYTITSGTGSVKLTKNLSYIFGPNEWGYSKKNVSQNPGFTYSLSKHLLKISLRGISYKNIEEDIFIDPDLSTKQYQIKLVSSKKSETKTIKTEGIVLATVITVVCAELILLMLGSDLFNMIKPIPGFG